MVAMTGAWHMKVQLVIIDIHRIASQVADDVKYRQSSRKESQKWLMIF